LTDFAREFVREPATSSPEQYATRVYRLAGIYIILVGACVIGDVLLVWQGKLFVTLAQRSNVEGLTLAFLLVFFTYVAIISVRGAYGGLRILSFWLRGLFPGGGEIEEMKARAIDGRRAVEGPMAALNVVIECEGHAHEPVTFELRDEFGSTGTLTMRGARLTYQGRCGSNNLLAYFCQQVQQVVGERLGELDVDVVQWGRLDDEATRMYLGMVTFATNLARHLAVPELWPKLVLREAEYEQIVERLAAVCPALRFEAFLPDVEYAAEHRLPIIPEPLGIAALSRSERRADPVATMGLAAIVVSVTVAIIGFLILVPPWLPAK
jgi:hypothetical protein